jgi:hypothetical protein
VDNIEPSGGEANAGKYFNRSVDVAGPGLVTLLIIQIIIGYEWLSSGITKVASGDFASGLAADLKEQSGDAAHWYKSFLDGTVIPNGRLFGVSRASTRRSTSTRFWSCSR